MGVAIYSARKGLTQRVTQNKMDRVIFLTSKTSVFLFKTKGKPEDQWFCSSPETINFEQAYGNIFL